MIPTSLLNGCCWLSVCWTDSDAGKILNKAGVSPQNLNRAIEEIFAKGVPLIPLRAEEGYDALKKYARDLTQDARAMANLIR